jgi:hypothetical protein
VQLTPEHAAGLINFWQLAPLEADYFLLLVDHERAGSPQLRRILERQLRELASRAEPIKESGVKAQDDQAAAIFYYSSWRVSAIHLLISIEGFQTAEIIARHLQLDSAEVFSVLMQLEQFGFAKREGDEWKAVLRFVNLEKWGFFSNLHHKNWRSYVGTRMDSAISAPENFHLTAASSISAADFKKIRDIVKEAGKRVKDVVDPSPAEVCAVLTIDWVRF